MDAADDVRLLAGRYELCSVIGRGGMGTVWCAHDQLLNRDVAIKEITWPPYLSEAEQSAARRRALVEAQLAARLRHPNIVGVYDIVEGHGRPWIVMELFRYRSLRDILREDGPLPPAQVARLGLGILAALRAAHAEGIVHRDVKPGNILLSPGGRAVLTDFGIARAAGNSTLTADRLVGSPSYIAPERAWGGQAGPSADLWALGAALYAALEGRAPFERNDALASLTATVTDEPEPAIHAGPLWPVISGLLRKDPATRLGPDKAELMLEHAARAGEAQLPAPGAADPGTPQRRSRRALGTVTGAVAVTAMTAGAAFALSLGGWAGRPAAGVTAGLPASASPPLGRGSPEGISAPSSRKPAPPPGSSVVAAAVSSRTAAKADRHGAKAGKLPPGRGGLTASGSLPANVPPGGLAARHHPRPGKHWHLPGRA